MEARVDRSQPVITPADVERLRAETPGVEHVLHLNNAGAALPPAPVLEAMTDHLTLEATIGGYEAAAARQKETLRPYRALAQLLNCHHREIAVAENATRAWDLACYSLPWERGDRLLTGMNEYASNYIAYLQLQRRHGIEVTVVPDDEHGQIDTRALADAIDSRTKLIALTHVPTNGGLVNPAAEVGRIAREAGVTYLLDACQSVGQMPVDVEEIGCDLLSGTARKFLRGPRGVGFLYARRELAQSIEPLLLDLRSAEWTAADDYEIAPGARRFETWEGNVAGKIALGVAVDYALDVGLEDIRDRVYLLADRLRALLREVPGVTIEDLGRERCGIVSWRHETTPAKDILLTLRERAINVSLIEPWHTRLDSDRRGLPDLVRSSVHYYNHEDELDRFVEAVRDIVG